MNENPRILKEKIRFLESRLKACDSTAQKYRRALDLSHKRIQKISQELNSGLKLVRELYKNLFPFHAPVVPGFRLNAKFQPAEQGISGDFFNVIKWDKMSFGILLAHCESYSASSLFLSSLLQEIPGSKRIPGRRQSSGSKRIPASQKSPGLQQIPGQRQSPGLQQSPGSHQSLGQANPVKDFVSSLHKKLAPALKQNERFHIFYGLVSARSFTMDYCLAGDIFAGCKSAGKSFQTLKGFCPGLTAKPSSFKEGRLVIQPEDALLFCSPGVLRSSNGQGRMFGEKNIIRAAQSAVGALEIRQNVLFASNEFGKNRPRERDMTVIVAQADKRVLRLSPQPLQYAGPV